MNLLSVFALLAASVGIGTYWTEGEEAPWRSRIQDGAVTAIGTFALLCLLGAVFGVIP